MIRPDDPHRRGVTVAVVARNEGSRIIRALNSLASAGIPFPWEILVVDNGSTDDTKPSALRFQGEHPEIPLRWIDHHPNNLGAARTRALEQARFHVVAFLDADCVAPPGWMEKSYAALLRHEPDGSVLGIGSGNFPPRDQDEFNEALALQLASPLGHLNTPQARLLESEQEVSHLPTCNAFYFRDRALGIGGFSSAFPRVCEDLEFSLRARERGFRLLYLPGTEVAHAQRPSWRAWAAKMFRYGWGQVEVARLYPRHLLGAKGLPLLGGTLLIFAMALAPVPLVFALLLYLGLTGLYATVVAFQSRRPRLSAHIFLFFVVTHAFYSLGELWGVCRQVKRRKMQEQERQ